jgi:hypothetical protein
MFVISQMVNIKYYFDDCLPNTTDSSIPVCNKDFFLELILYAKIFIAYAIYGLILAVYWIMRKIS